MVYITLDSLILALDDLLTKRLPALQSFDAGKSSVKFFTLRRARIAALPPELRGRPLADELAAADVRHDGQGGALWFYTEAILRHPDSTPAMIAAAKAIRAAFIPSLDALQARYDVEAKAAKDHEPHLVTLQPDLMMFPVPVPAGGTLHDWAAGSVQAGKQIDLLLSTRADAKDRKLASTLRGELVSKLTRLRQDLLDEQKDDPALPADLEAQVFGYFDLLEKNDADAAAAEKAGTPAPPPAPPAGP